MYLGLELGPKKHDLTKIEQTYSEVEHRCSEVLEMWLQRNCDASWDTLRKALAFADLDQVAMASMTDQRLAIRKHITYSY